MADVVTTAWLADHLEQPWLRLLDMRGSFSTYETAHIPGAQMLHIESLRLSREGIPCQMLPVPMLAETFGRLGIGATTPVALYATRPLDQVSATYALWSLAVAGNPHAHLLDGGLDRWTAEARPVTQSFPAVTETPFVPEFQADIYADWTYVRDHLGYPDVALVDSRTARMYAGLSGPTQRRGHIPGAVLHNYMWDFAPDGTYLPLDTLRARYEQAGITPDKEVVTYCVTGREGSAVWFVPSCLLGYPQVRLYQASMTEWCAHPDLPVVRGLEPFGREERKAA
jgi:thiosulfate/3-mercaptopyruvate sulfurtransferase